MTDFPENFSDRQLCTKRLSVVLMLFALLLAPLSLLVPKAVVPLVFAAALGSGLVLGLSALPWHVIDRRLTGVIALLTAWCLVSSWWSIHPVSAATLALRIGILLFLLIYLAGLMQLLDDGQRKRIAYVFCLGFAITLAIVAIELPFGTPIFTLLHGTANSENAAYVRLNRGVSALAILVWPTAVFTWRQGWHAAALVLPPVVLALTLLSLSSASMLALGAALLAAVLASLSRTIARLVLATAIVGTLLAAPLAAELVERTGIDQNGQLHENSLHRLHIWGVVSERIAERPIFGWGFDASPDLPTAGVQPFKPGKKIIPSHPHNASLQIMVEIGVIGSLLVLVLLTLIAQRIDSLAPVARVGAIAMLVTVFGIASTAYGIWQSHWLALIGSAVAIFIAALPAPAAGIAKESKPAGSSETSRSKDPSTAGNGLD